MYLAEEKIIFHFNINHLLNIFNYHFMLPKAKKRYHFFVFATYHSLLLQFTWSVGFIVSSSACGWSFWVSVIGGVGLQQTTVTQIGSSFRISTTSLWVSPLRGMPFTLHTHSRINTQRILHIYLFSVFKGVCVFYLQKFVSTADFSGTTDRSLWKHRANEVTSSARIQTDAQPTVFTELLHLSHLHRWIHRHHHYNVFTNIFKTCWNLVYTKSWGARPPENKTLPNDH